MKKESQTPAFTEQDLEFAKDVYLYLFSLFSVPSKTQQDAIEEIKKTSLANYQDSVFLTNIMKFIEKYKKNLLENLAVKKKPATSEDIVFYKQVFLASLPSLISAYSRNGYVYTKEACLEAQRIASLACEDLAGKS